MRLAAVGFLANSSTKGLKTMEDKNITAKLRGGAVQNTGNPVFDGTVNVAMGAGTCKLSALKAIHETLLELYSKEPGSEHWNPESEATKD